ncbi:MAG: hypothetical protein ACYC6Y_03825, partial [Thermoguttaceae bacterium]
MTGSWFSRQVFWKEYRQIRAFWWSVFALTVLLQLIVAVASGGEQAEPVYGLALCFSVLYALGCGATMFAVEHENGTYEFLRALPVKAWTTFVSKMAYSLLSAPLLFAACLLSGRIIARTGDFPLAMALVGWAVGSLVLLLWATLFSLLLHHVVKAALLGGLAAASMPVIGAIIADWFHASGLPVNEAIAIAAAGIMAVVLAADLWLGARWFCEASSFASDEDLRTRRDEATAQTSFSLESMQSRSGSFGRLVWLQWRQSQGMVLILTAMLAPLVFSLVSQLVFDRNSRLREMAAPLLTLSIFAAMAVVPLAGASVFAGDQRQHQFRFLTDRGVSPRLVWWSRHPVWLGALAAWIAIALVPLYLLLGGPFSSRQFDIKTPSFDFAMAAVCIPLAYSVGQFCSMILRSGILAGTFSVVGSILLGQWAFLMSILGVPLSWSVVPIPVILLLATRLRTRGWMLESNRLWSWLPVIAVLLLPGAGILAGACLHRAYELPLVEPGFDPTPLTVPATHEAEETARMYARAHELAGGQPRDPDMEQAADLVLEASKRPQCDSLVNYLGEARFREKVRELVRLVRDSGRQLQRQGELDKAADRYLAGLRMARHLYLDAQANVIADEVERDVLDDLVEWAGQTGQNKDLVLKTLREVEQLTAHPAPCDYLVKARYVAATKLLDGSLEDLFAATGSGAIQETAPALMLYWFPWERERARRMVCWLTDVELQAFEQARSSLAAGGLVNVPPVLDIPDRKFWWLRFTPDAWIADFPVGEVRRRLVTSQWHRRVAHIKIALAAWQVDHPSLPEKLEDLEGEFLAEVPHDPYTGEVFVYFPRGTDGRVTRFTGTSGKVRILAGATEPFFWSPGPTMRVDRSKQSLDEKYLLWDGKAFQKFRSPNDLWAAGVIFL